MTLRPILMLLAAATFSASTQAQNARNPLDAAAPVAKVWGPINGDSPVPLSPFQPDLTPGYVLIEGDIQIRLDQYLALLSGADATFGAATFWPSGIVPYDFVTSGGGAVSGPNQTAAVSAMNDIAQRAGVTFRPATVLDFNRIRFQNSSFNNSPVGMQGGVQTINIVSWNSPIIICHELYHSLGFWHEQSRLDRNTYVTIATTNICGSGISTPCTAGTGTGQCCLCVDGAGACIPCGHNFNLQFGSLTYGTYDFDSFMHYGPTAFSCNGLATITVNAPFSATIGQRDHFSFYDRITCRGLYPFATDRWLDHNYFGPLNGDFLQPWNYPFLTAAALTPSGGTLFVKFAGTYSAVGTYTNPVTIEAPAGTVTLGN